MKKELARREENRGLAPGESIDQWLSDVLEGRRSPFTSALQFDWQPKVDISENDREITLAASIPGVEKQDVNVEVKDNLLIIRGERKEESEKKEKGGYLRREQSYGSFYRSFQLPENVKSDEIKATGKNGVIEIHIPKTEQAEVKGKKIAVD